MDSKSLKESFEAHRNFHSDPVSLIGSYVDDAEEAMGLFKSRYETGAMAFIGDRENLRKSIKASIIWDLIFSADKTIMILFGAKSEAVDFIQEVKDALDDLSAISRPKVASDGPTWLTTFGGASLIAREVSGDILKGRTINTIFAPDFDTVPSVVAMSLIQAYGPCVANRGRFIITGEKGFEAHL